jgi:hypothetical protein
MKGDGTLVESGRGTGRTTASVLRYLSCAIMARGSVVEACDHVKLTCRSAARMARMIKGTAKALGLIKIEVRCVGRRVFVRSEFMPSDGCKS